MSRKYAPNHYATNTSLNHWYRAGHVWACANCSLSFLFLSRRNDIRHGLLLLWPMCSTRSYSEVLLPPISSLENKVFSPRKLPLTGYFLSFFWPFSVNPRDGYMGNSQQISRLWNSQSCLPGTNSYDTLKAIEITFLILMLVLKQVILTMSWTAAMWLANTIFALMGS